MSRRYAPAVVSTASDLLAWLEATAPASGAVLPVRVAERIPRWRLLALASVADAWLAERGLSECLVLFSEGEAPPTHAVMQLAREHGVRVLT